MVSLATELKDSLNKRCGEVFLSQNGNVMFICSICDEIYKGCKPFFNHLKDHYFEDLNVEEILFCDEKSNGVCTIEEQNDVNFYKSFSIRDIKIERLDGSETQLKLTEFEIKQEVETDELSSYKEEIQAKQDAESIDFCKTEKNTLNTSEETLKPIIENTKKPRRFKLSLDSAERKYKCQECGFAFRDSSNLASHVRRHSDEKKRFQCTRCSKRFHSSTELNTHIRSHTKERPYLCPDCGQTFKTTSALATHIKRHKNQRDSQCSICEKRFYDDGLLRDHMLVHTGERSHKCPHCESSFSRIKALRCHLKLHENRREYQCAICSARFNQRPGLYSHMKSKHKIATKTSKS